MRGHHFKLAIAVLLLSQSMLAGCTRHVSVRKEMTWECAPEHEMRQAKEVNQADAGQIATDGKAAGLHSSKGWSRAGPLERPPPSFSKD